MEFLLTKSIREILQNDSLIVENVEFDNSLIKFLYEEINKKNLTNSLYSININEEKYIKDLQKYINNNKNDFKNDLIRKAKEIINEDKDINGDCGSLINKIFQKNYINPNSIDLISCIIEYIKEKIFNENLQKIFKILEHNNFLTTLIELGKDKEIRDRLSKDLIRELKNKTFEIKVDDQKYEPKFLFNYKIPGLYIFCQNLSNYLNRSSITIRYLNNETNIREYLSSNPDKIKRELNKYHAKEEELLNEAMNNINEDKIYNDIIYQIPPDLILKDYIQFYLDKYKNHDCYIKSSNQIIELLLKLRFSEEKNQIIQMNESEDIKIILIKIIWIESNVDYIKSILKVFYHAKMIINNDKDGYLLYGKIENLIKELSIKYIINPSKNPEHTREVNECFYLILASLCLYITSKEIILTDSVSYEENFKKNEIYIGNYYSQLKEINDILQNLNYDLLIYLNELYIIDELIKIIDYQMSKGIKIESIIKFRNILRDNALILQLDKKKDLEDNIKNLYNLLRSEERDEKYNRKFYDTLKYIFLKEIKKINDILYRATILELLIKEKDIIKISNDIFQIFLKSYFEKEGFKNTLEELLNGGEGKDDIIKFIDKKLYDEEKNNYFALSETLLYLFEKNSLIYLKSNKKSLDKEPMEIFKDCNKFLENKDKSEKYYDKLKNIAKLFCLGFIKAFCYTFIKRHEKSGFEPKAIIDKINKYDKMNMIKLYIYKIIYNLNNKQIDIFLKKGTSYDKYKLILYNDIDKFIEFKGEELFKDEIETLDNDNSNYKNIYNILLNYKNNGKFKKKITKSELINNNEDENNKEKFKFDNFYMASYNIILLNLKKNKFVESEYYNNFFINICVPLFGENKEEININEDNKINKLFKLIQFLFDKNEYSKIKDIYSIKAENIDSLLYGYRYCLNEIAEEKKRRECIYSSLYDINKIDYLKEKFYPGSDTKDESYYELLNKIENHFKEKPNEGCYVCLCNRGYYHSIPSGFPGYLEKNLKCPYCEEDIGSKELNIDEVNDNDEKDNKFMLIYEPVNRLKYFRIFEDEEEMNRLNDKKDTRNMLNKINKMTKKEFIDNYIKILYKKEKGLNEIDENKFKKDNKIIRNLSQITYRLLNYILYSHLFFARLYTNSDKFDQFLPYFFENSEKKRMTWFNTINKCFTLLQKELEKVGIKRFEIFMNLIFKELFNKLHIQECINKYEELFDLEDDIESMVRIKIKKAKEVIDNINKTEENNSKNKTSSINLLKEKYSKDNYNKNEFPYYEYFYYTDYPDENYIGNILEDEDKNKYPILIKYLEYKNRSKKDIDKYSADNFIIFNKVINLFNERYSNQITRKLAETQIIIDSDIYHENDEITKLIDKFISIINDFKLEYKEKVIKLDVKKNYINDFVINDNNKYVEAYKLIYKNFAKKQNDVIEDLLNKKCALGIFKSDCLNKINIQQIKESEIFTFETPKKFNFISVFINSSYRKIIDTGKYENYNDFIIFLDSIEEEMTDLLLKNKKILNCEFIEFKYKDEVFSNGINNLITNFESKYNITDLNLNDKILIYDDVINYEGNNDRYITIINDFINLIEYLYKIKNDEKNNNINEDTKINEIVKNLNGISEDFKTLFNENNDIIVKKISNCFDYYLKLIFKSIKNDLEIYQEIKEDKDKNKAKLEKNQEENKIRKNDDNKNKINENKTKKGKDEVKNPIFNLDNKLIKKLNNFFGKENKVITKELLKNAIRLFISIILYRENDKENKIKLNKNNIVGYLKEKDLWKNKNIRDKQFIDDLEELKLINIKINQILSLYYYLTDNKEEEFDKDIKDEYLKQKKNQQKPIQNSEDESIDKVSDKDSDQESDDDESKRNSKGKKRTKSRKNSDSSSQSNSRKSSRKSSDDSSSDSDSDSSNNKKRKARRRDD